MRTEDKAATAAALCDPRVGAFGEAEDLVVGDDLKAEFKAAKADALWVGPPWFPFDLSWLCDNIKNYKRTPQPINSRQEMSTHKKTGQLGLY